jgi:hypothetical protein
MVQPSSNYYHFVYGGYLETGTDERGFLFRGGHVERPVFRSAGYADQDSASYVLVGTQLTRTSLQRFSAFAGGGAVRGYMKEDRDHGERASYQIRGLMTAIEYQLDLIGLNLGVAHHAFIGFSSKEELRAYVAWPYNFLLLKMGMSW